MKKESDEQKAPTRHRSRAAAALLSALLYLFSPGAIRAQTYEVLQPGLFQSGNAWAFNSQSGSTVFSTTWTIKPGSSSGTVVTVILREDAPAFYTDDMIIVPDQTAMTIKRVDETQYTSPTQKVVVNYTDWLEKIPRLVNQTDSKRLFGHGVSDSWIVGKESTKWHRTQDQWVTFISKGNVKVPAGEFDCVTFRVDETWTYTTNGWTGRAERRFSFNPAIGPISMDYEVWEYQPDGSLYRDTKASHQLKSFAPAVPDLIADQIAFAPTSVGQGTTVTVSWREKCLYQNTATSHQTSVYLLSTNAQITNPIVLLTSKTIPRIDKDRTYSTATTQLITPRTSAGTYYVAVLVDSLNKIPELDENNVFVSQGPLTIIAKPDLTVTTGSFSPAALGRGDTLHVTGTIANIGGTTAPATWAHVYLSTDSLIATNDYPLITGIRTSSTLSVGASWSFSREIIVPASLVEGSYYVGIMCDADNAVKDEITERNNSWASSGTLLVGRADLTVTSGGFAPAIIAPGGMLAVTGTIQNIGGTTAPATSARAYLSSDTSIVSKIGPNDFLFIDSISIPKLAHSAQFTFTQRGLIPLQFPPWWYHIIIASDVADVVSERNEQNNVFSVPQILAVGWPKDLRVEDVSFSPMSVAFGQQIRVQAKIKNWGMGPPAAEASSAGIYLSLDSVITTSDIQLPGALPCPSLVSGEMFTINAFLVIPATIPAGNYYVGVFCDITNKVKEGDETNNGKAAADRRIYIGGPTPADHWSLYR